MKPRQRFINALSMQESDDFVPAWEIEFHLFNKASEQKMVVSEEYVKLTSSEKDTALRKNAEIMVDVARRLGLSALSNIGPYWEVAPGTSAPMWLPPEDSQRFLPLLRKAAGDEIAIVEWCQAMILMPEADDYVEFAYKLFDAPDDVDTMAGEKYAAGIEIAKRARDAGADALCAACDIADNKGMYFSPEQLDRYFMPYLRQWCDEVHKMDMKTILHSDGDLSQALDKLADTELDALQAIDPVAGMDIVEVKQKVGDKLCLCGNINLSLLLSGPIEAIRDEVKRVCLGCKASGGFVLGATNAVFEEIPLSHYQAMLEAGREFGKY